MTTDGRLLMMQQLAASDQQSTVREARRRIDGEPPCPIGQHDRSAINPDSGDRRFSGRSSNGRPRTRRDAWSARGEEVKWRVSAYRTNVGGRDISKYVPSKK
ncbi:hypothetical protein [Rhodococcoides fascians]|uniref:hypothetical protein n=1 Tax=Rhodococcoides fascians TaxID=1828 RepID=UPI0005642280|nr:MULTISPECIES: hypothetical protein [Rhodococcus]OZF03640.1 hypothetical protein CH301_09630 [Rhodococcus sp. 15-1189-1-1a]OZF17445.1 hypothetical protein CH299_10180 [Rhodococcus sp. 14-2686-1-2]